MSDNPDTNGCENCGNPNCLTYRMAQLRVRVVTDDEGDTYVHRSDLALALSALIDAQQQAGGQVNDPEVNDLVVGAQAALAGNLGLLLHDEGRLVAPTTVDDIPDTLPESWIGEL